MKTARAADGAAIRTVRDECARVARLDAELCRRIEAQNPTTYGFPDLLRRRNDGEGEVAYRLAQDAALREFVEARFAIVKDGRRNPVRLAHKMVEYMGDVFYRRVRQAILWKGRGAGGSFTTAIVIFLMMVYHKMSFTLLAGSEDQADNVYQYVTSFWNLFPEMGAAMLDGDPLKTELRLKNGIVLRSITASDKSIRGKHVGGLVIDEACQDQSNTDELFTAATQSTMSEPEYTIVLLSTFHFPVGFFQATWDFAEERGFKRYQWNIFHAAQRCTAGLEKATPEDPKALTFCRNECPLTLKTPVLDNDGTRTGTAYEGCNGLARESDGFTPRTNILAAEQLNRGSNKFRVEFCCERPEFMKPIYPVEWIEASFVHGDWPPQGQYVVREKSVGIDWGLESQCCVLLSVLLDPANPGTPKDPSPLRRCVAILHAEFMTGKLTDEVVRILRAWMGIYGQERFYVYPDASHPYNNMELSNLGFDVRPVPFAKWKEFGIGNFSRLFANGRLKIRADLSLLVEQLKRYRTDKYGKALKRDDHGPDAGMCALLHYPYDEKFNIEETAPKQEPNQDICQVRRLITPPAPAGISTVIVPKPGFAEVGIPGGDAVVEYVKSRMGAKGGQVTLV